MACPFTLLVNPDVPSAVPTLEAENFDPLAKSINGKPDSNTFLARCRLTALVQHWAVIIARTLWDMPPTYGGNGPSLLKLGWALGAIATTIIILRIYTRIKVTSVGNWALFWALVAWTLTMLVQCFGTLAIHNGVGNHIEIIAENGRLEQYLLYTWIAITFFHPACAFSRVSVASFLLEIQSQTNNRKIRYSLWFVGITNVLLALPFIYLCWVQCDPVPQFEKHVLPGECATLHQVVVYSEFQGSWSIASDLFLATVPMYIIWPLQMNKRLKIGVISLMSLGIFASIASILRTASTRKLEGEDPSFSTGTLFLWGIVEEWVLVIVLNIPPVWPLVRHYYPTLVSSMPSLSFKRSSGTPASGGSSRRKGSSERKTSSVEKLADVPKMQDLVMKERSQGSDEEGWIELSGSDRV
ncbi:MAG: hypothetical protein M1831_000791 [Alyxoria varia]|nr:MAG: hypothetical protein M1831_000791 [Alyxoria varia]